MLVPEQTTCSRDSLVTDINTLKHTCLQKKNFLQMSNNWSNSQTYSYYLQSWGFYRTWVLGSWKTELGSWKTEQVSQTPYLIFYMYHLCSGVVMNFENKTQSFLLYDISLVSQYMWYFWLSFLPRQMYVLCLLSTYN